MSGYNEANGAEVHTTDSWGNKVTNAINNSQPAFRLIALEDCFLNASAPSLRALTSSNIVPATDLH